MFVKTGLAGVNGTNVTKASSLSDHLNVGSKIGEVLIKDLVKTREFYLEYKSPESVIVSDIVKKDNIIGEVSLTPAAKMNRKVAIYQIGVKNDALFTDGGTTSAIPGQDYIITVKFRQFIGGGDDNFYIKTASVRGTRSMTKAQLIFEMAVQLWLNFSRDQFDLVNIEYDGKVIKNVTVDNGVFKVTGIAANGITESTLTVDNSVDTFTIRENPQPYTQGTRRDKPVYFEVSFGDVEVNKIVVDGWGAKTDLQVSGGLTQKAYDGKILDYTYVPNGRQVADLEWATTAQRGDTYKTFGWPRVVETKYVVDPDAEYDLIDIHYFDTKSNEGVQRSEKDLTIAVPAGEGDDVLALFTNENNTGILD